MIQLSMIYYHSFASWITYTVVVIDARFISDDPEKYREVSKKLFKFAIERDPDIFSDSFVRVIHVLY